MDESKSKSEKQQNDRRFDPELLKKGLRCDRWQYKFLKECSEKGEEGIKEWNQWREEHPDEDIILEGANLNRAYLEGAKLQNAVLWEAKLQRAILRETCLQGANLKRAHLQGAEFGRAKLQGADFSRAIVDGETLLWGCKIDRKTKFEGVALGNMRIYPKEKELLECNIRRMNWEQWYKWKDWYEYKPEKERNKSSQFFLKNTIGWFWAISDYGRSTGRIIFTFFGLALIFANIYYYWGAMDYYILHYILRVDGQPGFVSYLFVDKSGVALSWWLVPLRTLYFSIVTMTTLGFGDMYANAQSIWGHILLSVQVILGYVLLGALVTRFAVLFTAGGPAGKFANENKGIEK